MDMERAFQAFLKGRPDYQEALDIVRTNSEGPVWLIGGFLYRGLSHELHGSPEPHCDFDFLVEKARENLRISEPWSLNKNRFGGIKLCAPEKSIDLVVLKEVYSIVREGLTPNVKNYLDGVPLTIQYIIYDCSDGSIAGDIGLNALRGKTIGVHSPKYAHHAARRKETTIQTMIEEKAHELGFRALF